MTHRYLFSVIIESLIREAASNKVLNSVISGVGMGFKIIFSSSLITINFVLAEIRIRSRIFSAKQFALSRKPL